MEAKRFFLNPHLFIKIGAKSKSRSRTSRWQWLRSMPWTSPPELWIKPMNKQFVKLYKHLSRKLCESWTGLALRWEKCKGNRRADRNYMVSMSMQFWEFTKIWGCMLHECKGSALLKYNTWWEFDAGIPFSLFSREKSKWEHLGLWGPHAEQSETPHLPPRHG